MSGSLTLKWGTIKDWRGLSEDATAALQKFADLGMSLSAMAQNMTPAHVAALEDLIDLVDEPIRNDWSGVAMTREEAKAYVRDYAATRSGGASP